MFGGLFSFLLLNSFLAVYNESNKMQISALEKLVAKGLLTIQKKGNGWLVEWSEKMKPVSWLKGSQSGVQSYNE